MPREQRDKERERYLNPQPGESLNEPMRRRPAAYRAQQDKPPSDDGNPFGGNE